MCVYVCTIKHLASSPFPSSTFTHTNTHTHTFTHTRTHTLSHCLSPSLSPSLSPFADAALDSYFDGLLNNDSDHTKTQLNEALFELDIASNLFSEA